MDDPKALALFQEILTKTEARKLGWEMARQDEFEASMMGKYRLKLLPYTSLSNWGEPEGAPVLSLNDNRGNMLVEMTVNVEGITGEEMNRLLLYARRIALNVDQKIDEVLTELKKDENN